ncbi:hypothetical protein VNO80_19957 [Phaseolus coccineus]|uniref:Uncharacterized protein n=1 Tax=Phaseolus coccineus TaxID=3886 RepID=A0AAN9MLX0_PHACN
MVVVRKPKSGAFFNFAATMFMHNWAAQELSFISQALCCIIDAYVGCLSNTSAPQSINSSIRLCPPYVLLSLFTGAKDPQPSLDETKFSENNFDEEESQPPEEEALEESIERLELGAFVGHIGNSIMKERCAQVNVGKIIMKEAISGQCATKLGSPGSPSTKAVQDVLTNLLVAVEAVKSISKPIMGLAQSLSNPTQTSDARSGTREKGMGAEKNEPGSREDIDCQTKIRDSKDAKGESSPCVEKPSEPRRCSGQSPVDFAQLCDGRSGTCDEDAGAEEIECRSGEADERQSKVCELKGEKGKVSLCLQTSLEPRQCSTVGYGDEGVLNAMEPTLFEGPQTELIHHGDLRREGGQQSPDPLMLSCFPSAQVAECGDNFTTPTLGWKQRGLLEIGELSRQTRWRSLSSIINLQIGRTSHTSHTGYGNDTMTWEGEDFSMKKAGRMYIAGQRNRDDFEKEDKAVSYVRMTKM